jgi:replicative DNA helicase
MCLVGAYAQLNGYKVLQFVTEMSEEVMRDRYEAILYGLISGDFNYSRFKSGSFDWKEEENYFRFLDEELPKLTPLRLEVASGVSSVASKINQYNPDLVLIDSAYLMEDDRGAKEDWLRVAHITRDLKKLAKDKKTPIMINTQADSSTSVKVGAELGNIKYARSIGEDSDVVLSLHQDEQMREDKEMMVKVLKCREGVLGKVLMNWDLSRMNFESIYSTQEKQEEVEKPAREKPKKVDKPEGVIEL